MTGKEVKQTRNRLLEYRSLLIHQISEIKKSIREVPVSELRDSADRVWKFNTSNLWLSQGCLQSRRLQLVEDALDRIDRGVFGVCQQCGRAIEAKRLKAIPWAHLCLRCQEAKEALESLSMVNRQVTTRHLAMS